MKVVTRQVSKSILSESLETRARRLYHTISRFELRLADKLLTLCVGFGLLVFVNLLVITICNWKVESASQHLVSRDLSQIPPSKVGLLLGTSKYLRSGEANPYFYNRIDAAAELYQAGKIEYILVSGDNGSIYYNEPRDMKKALLERGIPEKSIYMDYAGFRTLDSVIRCKEIFGQHRFIVISQEFHTKRAVYIARTHGLETFGYNAKDVQYQGLELSLREKLARVKAFIDVNILMEKPRFLGERIPIK